MRPLSPKQARFVREYLTSRNGEQSAIKAGYHKKTARSQAARLLTKANVREEINRQREAIAARTLITADRLLQEIAHIAFADPADVSDESGNLIPVRDLPVHARKAIASIKVKRTVEDKVLYEIVEYKFWDKGQAQERISKHLGLYLEQEDIQALRAKLQELIAKIQSSQVGHEEPRAD